MTVRNGAACIVGVGQTELSKNSGKSASELAVEAAEEAIRDAGLSPDDIDGVIPCVSGATAEDLIGAFGLPDVTFSAASQLGGASPVASLQLASAGLNMGAARHIMVFIARNGSSGPRVAQRARNLIPGQQHRAALEYPYGMNMPAQWYSLICRRHMHVYGTSKEQLGAVSVTMRAHAQLNPRAKMYGRPITLDDYLESRPIAEPYSLLDCCIESDGAAAIILTQEGRARDLAGVPVAIRGIAEGRAESPDDISNRGDFFATGLTKAAPRCLGMAGVTPTDIDAAMIYDCFTFEVIHQLEEAGFCPRGDGGPFVADGNIARDGPLPVNPHGGLMSEGHLAGMNHIVEAVAQLRGTCGERQLPKADVIAVTGWGDMGDGAMAVLTRL